MPARASKISIGIIILLMTIISANLNWGKDYWKSIIKADAKGYYAYLPAVFIYGDLNFDFFQEIEGEKYFNINLYYDYRACADGKVVNKYYCGTAAAQLPFFIIAHGLSYLRHADMDGYSKLYPVLINISALFYLLLGLFYLDSTLILYKISTKYRCITLFAAVFGTNLFYYTVVEPGTSHIYSFAFIAMFLYYGKQYFLYAGKKNISILAALLGMIVLIRPLNGLIILILPFLAGNFNTLRQGLVTAFKDKLRLIYSGCLFLSIVFIQLLIYKISTGQFIIYAYGEEGFNFLHPHFIDILFSYRKGLFLYTPMFLLSFTGGWYLWKYNKFEFYTWFGFFILITYVLSSWWMWYYGGSFSSRVYVEYIPLFMILLGMALEGIRSKFFKLVFISVVILLVGWCQIQTYQYRYYVIHWSGMTKEMYWESVYHIYKLK